MAVAPIRLLLVLSLLAGAGAAAAETGSKAARRGGELYQAHCATCHGVAADGRGPMASVLVVPPRDLTGLAAANGGVFPLQRVAARIDGQDPLVSHGSPMPVYGLFFEGRARAIRLPDGSEITTTGPIADLLAYLQTLQHR
ncbi:c-type cytochrome [Pseudodonghicola flavimaris]|uniref:C-type cytochrome n=1 Tax=Pseudodonghicola flavimaris TaxID=3050036 RepID=A0ABT7F5S3_9RHOB|nr:cytochrome c [Pseudodonghicola flavimaris]MDK3019969.1 c-type cytochrome [Pseudodonghicola flavimaris]